MTSLSLRRLFFDACMTLPQGMIALYTANAGWMVVFVYMVTLLGVVGNGARGLLPVPAALRRLLRSPKVAAVAVIAAVGAAHVETCSMPPTFREVTMKSKCWFRPCVNSQGTAASLCFLLAKYEGVKVLPVDDSRMLFLCWHQHEIPLGRSSVYFVDE